MMLFTILFKNFDYMFLKLINYIIKIMYLAIRKAAKNMKINYTKLLTNPIFRINQVLQIDNHRDAFSLFLC